MMKVAKCCQTHISSFINIIIIAIEIAWERAEYTVREEDESLEMCIEASRIPTILLALYQVIPFEGTASEETGKLPQTSRLLIMLSL